MARVRTRFFGRQAHRLLREDAGWTADLLAEELYALERDPIETDQTITIIRNGDDPAIRIIQGPGTTTPPIVIHDPNTGIDEPFDPTNPGGGGGGGGDGGDDDDGDDDPAPPAPPDPLNPAPPPSPGSYRLFTANLQVRLVEPNNPFGWDGQSPSFTGVECRPYNPPLINAPTTALAFPTVLDKLNTFISRNGLSGNYIILVDTVSDPGNPCVP